MSTVGLNEATIRKYIQEQEKYDIMRDKLSVKEWGRFCNIDGDARFELDREAVGEDSNLLDKALNLILVKLRDLGFLLADP